MYGGPQAPAHTHLGVETRLRSEPRGAWFWTHQPRISFFRCREDDPCASEQEWNAKSEAAREKAGR